MGNINHLCLLADCMQNLPENMKPCSGPLIEIIISVSACAASSLSTSLKSINENVCRVFQRSFACMNDLMRASTSTRKQIISAHIFLGAMDWTILHSVFFYSLPNYKSFKTFKSCSVCSPKMNMCRNNLFACRFSCSRCHIHACKWDNWHPPKFRFCTVFALKVML